MWPAESSRDGIYHHTADISIDEHGITIGVGDDPRVRGDLGKDDGRLLVDLGTDVETDVEDALDDQVDDEHAGPHVGPPPG